MMAVLKAPMIAMPRQVYRSVCPNPWKDRFTSRPQADAVLKDMHRRSRYGKNRMTPQKPYRCACGGWHFADTQRARAYEARR